MTAAPLEVATDGSCLSNPGPGGWAAAVMRSDHQIDPRRWVAGGAPATTNNAMELTAIVAALKGCGNHPGPLVIVTDSRYAVDALTAWIDGWKRRGWTTSSGTPVKNRSLIVEADRLLDVRRQTGRPTDFRWVRGHAGHGANEFVDQQARRAAFDVQAGTPPDPGPGLDVG